MAGPYPRRRGATAVCRPLAPVTSLTKEAFDSAWAHNISRMAGSIAYFGAFSLAPMMVIMTTLASLVFGKSAVEGLIAERLTSTFGAETANFIQSMLAAIYNWFTDGLDTADLIDAKTLLDELSA